MLLSSSSPLRLPHARIVAAHKVTTALSKLFLDRLPAVPALNKWVASYPMLAWLSLGRLCHSIMTRVWTQGVLETPGLLVADDNDDDDAAAVGQDTEESFRRARSRRARRVLGWMQSEVRQLWSCAALMVTEPIAVLLGDYLRDEGMYVPAREAGAHVSPWAAHRYDDSPNRPVPTLLGFMQGDLGAIRRVQQCLGELLSGGNGSDSFAFLVQAFGALSEGCVALAVQHLVCETLADLYLRFIVEYRGFPYRLLLTVFDETPQPLKLQIATEFLALPECCRTSFFEGNLMRMFPTPDSLLSAEATELIKAWGDKTLMITRSVEYAHRVNKAHARGRGVARAIDLRYVVDDFILSRAAVSHNAATQRKPSSRPRLRQHPRVQAVLKRLKQKNTRRAGVGGNAKYAWLNEQRAELAKQGLTRPQFAERLRALREDYDRNPLLQQAAKDRWRATRAQRLAARLMGPARDQGPVPPTPCSSGPWGLGDGFWPLAEESLSQFLAERGAKSGMRAAAGKHREWQCQRLVLTASEAEQPFDFARAIPASVEQTCAQRHPGMCRDAVAKAALAGVVEQIKTALHGIRPGIKARYLSRWVLVFALGL